MSLIIYALYSCYTRIPQLLKIYKQLLTDWQSHSRTERTGCRIFKKRLCPYTNNYWNFNYIGISSVVHIYVVYIRTVYTTPIHQHNMGSQVSQWFNNNWLMSGEREAIYIHARINDGY